MPDAAYDVAVVASRHLADPQQAGLESVIDRQSLDHLPINTRNFLSYSLLTNGSNPDRTPQQGASRTSGVVLSGQRARSNNVTVDGLDNNDETVGSIRAMFSQDAVQEFQVLTNGFSAEFGKAAGGVINVVTRSGTNTTRGTVYGFFRDDSLNARNYFERFSLLGDPIDVPKAPYGQQQFGAALGGPVRKDRLFYFASIERQQVDASNFVTIDDESNIANPFQPGVSLGTPADILRTAGFSLDTGHVPYAIRSTQWFGKIDQYIGASQRLSVRVNGASELNENIEPFGGLVARSRAAVLDNTDFMGAVTHNLVATPRLVNEARFLVALRDQLVSALDPACDGDCDREDEGGPTIEVAGVRQPRTAALHADAARQPPLSVRRHAQLQPGSTPDQGRHRFQHRQRLAPGAAAAFRRPLHLHGPAGDRRCVSSAGVGDSGGGARIPRGLRAGIRQFRLGLRLSRSVALRRRRLAGASARRIARRSALRTSVLSGRRRATLPACRGRTRGPPTAITSRRRLAVTWDPTGSAQTVVRTAYGLYYDPIITATAGITRYISGQPDTVRTFVLPFPNSRIPWLTPDRRLQEATALQLVGGSYPSVAITIDPGLRNPYTHQAFVGVDHLLAPRVRLSVGFVYARGFKQLGTIDYNPVLADLGPGRRPADINGQANTSASVLQYTSFGETWFRGLTMSLDGRSGNTFFYRVGYTLAKAEDTSTDFQSAFLPQNNGRGRDAANLTGNPIGFDPASERGPALHDERHRVTATATYTAPWDITLSGLFSAASGWPYNILAGTDLNMDRDGGSFPSDRARVTPADPSSSLPRNSGRLPSQVSVDARVSKSLRLSERVELEGIFEVFNVFNRSNFIEVQNVFGVGAYPANPAPTFGRFTQAGNPRQMQLAARVRF